MQRIEFDYPLPKALIAQTPPPERGASRLLYLDARRHEWRDLHFNRLATLLRVGDLLVFNDTRVIPARLFGTKDTGGQVEMMVERVLNEKTVLAQVRASKPPKVGQSISLNDSINFSVIERSGEFYRLTLQGAHEILTVLNQFGHVPLPPYIERADEAIDRERYQTVFAREPGAVAAPTAGLHFDEALMQQLAGVGVEQAFVTLHVGAGTFQPMRVDRLDEHRMHAERFSIGIDATEKITRAKREGRRVIAVGTTVVRVLESVAASSEGVVKAGVGETEIFIYPGFKFKVIDALITNFHLPQSTLLMLVCAFAGKDFVLKAYRHAVEQRYRFFSYGDAMFVTPK
jgi:S-adenosylmethionine:tRNA ribosyltransferase-isomerase